MKKVNITQAKFKAYLDVQQSGMTNMFNTQQVEILSGLSNHEILDIMMNYNQYLLKWGSKQ